MKIKKNEDNQIVIDPVDLLREMTGEQKEILIDDLSCEDEIIKKVSEQIIYGCTETGWSGSISSSHKPSTPLDIAIREVSNNSGIVAKGEIKRLENLVRLKEESLRKSWDRIRDLEDEIRILRAVYP